MTRYEPKLTETTEDRLQNAINLSRKEVLKEVLKWLDEITIDDADGCGHPIVSLHILIVKKCS